MTKLKEMKVKWEKCNYSWGSFMDEDLKYIAEVGTYVIWRPVYHSYFGTDHPRRTVYVGSGNVADRIGKHREDKRIKICLGKDKFLFTWTNLSKKSDRLGVEKYLAMRLDPIVGEKHPDVPPVRVNLPDWN